MTPDERKASLDATAEERAASLGKEHVTDGAQPYHAGATVPDAHVPGNEVVDAAESEVANA